VHALINALTQTSPLERARRWSAVPLRLIVGWGFIAHGYAKVVSGPAHLAASLDGLGVPAPHAMAWVTIGLELVGGLAVLIGAWIPVISVPLATILLVAAITVHRPYGFNSIKLLTVTEAGPQFGPPGYGPTCCISPHWQPSCSAARVHGASTSWSRGTTSRARHRIVEHNGRVTDRLRLHCGADQNGAVWTLVKLATSSRAEPEPQFPT